MTEDTIVCHFVVYEDSADLDVDMDGDQPVVTNHDELVESGKTYDEVRVLEDNQSNREMLHESMILTPEDAMWREEYASMDVGESRKLTV